MEQKAAFLEKLERELAKIKLKPMEEMGDSSETEPAILEHEGPESSLALSPNLDNEKTNETAVENPVLTCTIIDAAEGFEDLVLVSKEAEVSDLERAISSLVLDEDGKGTQALNPRTVSKCPRVQDHSKEANGSPPVKVPRTARTGFDSEEGAIAQDSDLYTNERSATAKGEKANDEDASGDSQDEDGDSEGESEEELMPLLLPEEKKELEMMGETTKLHGKLIDTRVKELHSKLKKEAEAHCLSIKQKAIDEILIFKRSSSVVVDEYHRAILMVMKYFELQLKKVSSYQKSAQKLAIDDFKESQREVFDNVRERQRLCLEEKVYRKRERTSYIHNPFVFYMTFVIVMTVYSALIAHLLHLSSIGELH